MKGQHLVEKLKNIIIESCPEADKRTNIAPVNLIIRLIVGLSGNNNALSFESTRRDLILQTGTPISRSAFWERLSTNRLFQILVDIFARMTCLLSKKASVMIHCFRLLVLKVFHFLMPRLLLYLRKQKKISAAHSRNQD